MNGVGLMFVGEMTVCEITFPAFGLENPERKAGLSRNGLNVILIGQNMPCLLLLMILIREL